MKAFIKLFAILLLLSGIAIQCTSPKEEKKSIANIKKVDSLFAAISDFSGVVLIADKGKPIYYKSMGFRNFETKIPVDTADIFELASVSKQFTSMVIMMLKEEGKLNYDDPIENYLADIPYQGITIRHLLTHTSGLPDYQTIMDEHWDKSKVAGNDDILEYLRMYHPPSLFIPGSKYEYSNTGYVLLGSIAEKASGLDFIEFCRKNIFTPLRMTDTDLRTPEEKKSIQNFALGHIYVEGKQRYVRADSFPSSNYTIWLGNRKGPGRISSTARDLLKWDQALYSNDLLPQAILSDAFKPYKLSNDSLSYYGFGWMLDKTGKKVMHTGGNPGYNTKIVRYLGNNRTIILLCNNAHSKFPEVAKQLESLIEEELQ
jgi:CubicO group peptidase (beta-lactamase class C family)